ncbi:MAG: ATP-dependent helicase [Lachnospiraceae bacterium]
MAFNEAQKQAILHKEGPMLVLAGPGSGKTTVITNRIRYLTRYGGVNPSSVLVITFTRAAAREMEERYNKMSEQEETMGSGRVSFGTFHSVFFRILKLAYGFTAANIVREDQKIRCIRESMEKLDLDVEDETEFVSSILSEISTVKGEMLNLEHYYSKNCGEDSFRALYQSYEQFLKKYALVDFDDMLTMCYELFRQRADILSAWQKKYQYLLIDEFQDINRIQYEIIKMMALPENNLFIVGDDDQSIYRFRGSKPEIMLGFEKDYPQAKKTLLGMNYRSSKEIVEAAGRLICHNEKRFPKKLLAVRGQGKPVITRVFDDARQEVISVAEEIRDYRRSGLCYGDIAVLFRTNVGARLLVEKFMEYNIPFRMKDLLPNIYEHWVARDILSYIDLADGSRDRGLFLRIINRPKRYISRDAFDTPQVDLEKIKSFYQDKNWMLDRLDQLEYDLAMLKGMAPVAAVNYIRKAVGYDEYLREYAQARRLKAEELMEMADQIAESASGYKTVDGWKRHMEEYKEELAKKAQEAREPSASDKESVTIMTMHGAKGLEFPVVYIPDANEGVTPHNKAALDADMEEERRMFYVAMTRAKDRLHVYYTKERYHKKQEVSRFVLEYLGRC